MSVEITDPVLEGKKALVVGIANEHSIAYGCAKAFHELGADLAITYLGAQGLRSAAQRGGGAGAHRGARGHHGRGLPLRVSGHSLRSARHRWRGLRRWRCEHYGVRIQVRDRSRRKDMHKL